MFPRCLASESARHLVALAVIFSGGLGCKKAEPDKAPREKTMTEAETTRWRVGRFAFRLPSTFALAARRQQIYFVRVEAEPLTEENTLDEAWSRRVATIRTRDATQQESLRETTIEPEMRALYYQSEGDDELADLTAQLVAGNHVLWLTTQGLVSKQAMMERLFGKVARGYVPSDQPGFWTGAGALTTKPGRTENAEISLEDPTTGARVEIGTRAVKKVSEGDPLGDAKEKFGVLEAFGIAGRVLASDKRALLNMEGFEGRVVLEKNGDKLLRLTWFYPGTPFDAFQPELSIELSGPADAAEGLEAIWDRLLESLHVVGQSG